MRADKKKWHYIYKITRFDGKYYIGLHSTDNLDDGYFGSGKKITRSIKKYGVEKHTKEIIEYLPTRQELKTRERQLVNEELLNDPLCMNLVFGGTGGWEYYNNNSDLQREKCIRGNIKQKWLKENDHNWKGRLNQAKTGSKNLKKAHKDGKIKYNTFTGKKHSEETKKKIGSKNSNYQLGKNNSQYGTIWITNGKENKKYSKCYTIPAGWWVGRKIIR